MSNACVNKVDPSAFLRGFLLALLLLAAMAADAFRWVLGDSYIMWLSFYGGVGEMTREEVIAYVDRPALGDRVRKYMTGESDTPQGEWEWMGEIRPLFSESELAWLADVKRHYGSAQTLRWAWTGWAAATLAWQWAADGKRIHAGAAKKTSWPWLLAGGYALMGVMGGIFLPFALFLALAVYDRRHPAPGQVRLPLASFTLGAVVPSGLLLCLKMWRAIHRDSLIALVHSLFFAPAARRLAETGGMLARTLPYRSFAAAIREGIEHFDITATFILIAAGAVTALVWIAGKMIDAKNQKTDVENR